MFYLRNQAARLLQQCLSRMTQRQRLRGAFPKGIAFSGNGGEPGFPVIRGTAGLPQLWDYLVAQRSLLPQPEAAPGAMDFLAYCIEHMAASKAQLYQDLYAAYKLGGKKGGFFVEFGATDGVSHNNTCFLQYTLGWRGILAEPFPIWHERLHTNRRGDVSIDTRCVWTESGRRLEFLAANRYPALASLMPFARGDANADARLTDSGTIMVDTVSLNDLLAAHDAPEFIDYLSVDTEGSELEILSHFDFDRHKVRVLTVEHNHRVDFRSSLHALLAANGFVREFEAFSKWDDWYFHPDRV